MYLDDTAVILVKNTEENKAIINRFSQTNKRPKVSHLNKQKLHSLLQLAHFFNTVGWTEAEIKTYQDILKLDPKNCPVLYNLGTVYAQQQNSAASILAQRYRANCQ